MNTNARDCQERERKRDLVGANVAASESGDGKAELRGPPPELPFIGRNIANVIAKGDSGALVRIMRFMQLVKRAAAAILVFIGSVAGSSSHR